MYESGRGVETNYELAFKYYHVAAEEKDYRACERLAYLYEKGLGVEQNIEESVKWKNLSKEYESLE